MSEAIISVEGLGKKYTLSHQAERQRYTALRDVLADKTKSVGKRLWSVIRPRSSGAAPTSPPGCMPPGQEAGLRPPSSADAAPTSDLRPPSSEDFWALRDVSFSVRQGEVVGIIGLPRGIDFHQPTHGTGTCPQCVCRAGTGERD